MKRKERKMERLVLGALLAGGAMFAPGVAMAADTVATDEKVTTDNIGENDPIYGNNTGTLNSLNTANGSGNTISVQLNTKTVGDVYGADAMTSTVSGNTVNMQSGTINGSIYGASSTGTVSGNIVNVYGGTVDGSVMGASTPGIATGNIVNIYAVEDITGGVYAGMSTNGNSSGNIINILGKISISGHLDGYGSQILNVASQDNEVSDIRHMKGYGFEEMNFYLPSTIKSGGTMLKVTGGNEVNLEGITFGVAAQSGVNLSKGDTVNLITNSSGLVTDDTLSTQKLTTDKTQTGLTVDTEYEFEISKSGTTSIIATVTKAEESPDEKGIEQAKSLVETRAATTTFVNAGADMLASQGFAQAANAVALEAAEQAKNGAAGAPAGNAFTPFATFGGSAIRAESGSYVDTKGFGLNIGFAKEFSNSQGKLLFGPVVEYGGGSYASHLDDGTRGDGKAHYWGVGVMARQVNHNGFYYEGSVRGGRVTSDYEGMMTINNADRKVDYDSASNYWAAHLGVGKAMEVGGGNTLDGYLKYFYSHQGGDSATIHIANGNDETGHFDSVNSHRLRVGARLTHKVNERNSFYGGLAYQYEFGGEARAHFDGGTAPSPSVKGSSGMLELGWQVKPGGPVTLDLGFTGWAGKQRGGSVQLGATWTF